MSLPFIQNTDMERHGHRYTNRQKEKEKEKKKETEKEREGEGEGEGAHKISQRFSLDPHEMVSTPHVLNTTHPNCDVRSKPRNGRGWVGGGGAHLSEGGGDMCLCAPPLDQPSS